MIIRTRGGTPRRKRGIDSPFPSTRSRVRRGFTLLLIHPRTFRITFTILLGFTLGSLEAIRGLAGDISERIVIVCRVIVIIVPRFTVSIALLVLDGNTWAEGLAICDWEVHGATARLPLTNVLADSYLDALVSK